MNELLLLSVICLLILLLVNTNVYEFYDANIKCPHGQKSCKYKSSNAGTSCALSACNKKCKGNPNIC
jgi:hypothetical protein